ncbi:hypothetical protein Y047_5282 [Burkholderia pseudomallei MSHR3016]|nr:hypothetical protein Y047_5282 [Burkholderia pseudomallei MSHR3016]
MPRSANAGKPAFAARAAACKGESTMTGFWTGEYFREPGRVSGDKSLSFTAYGEHAVLDAHHHRGYPSGNFSSDPTHGHKARQENRCGRGEC